MPQPKLHWSAYLWPGLPQLWARGSWAGLALAVGFTALANVLIATSLVWDEWLPVRARWIGLAVLSLIWLAAWFEGRADWRRFVAELTTGETAPTGDELAARNLQWFCAAQRSYLAGDWVAAEQTLTKLLKHDPRDAEALLLLATLLRHEGRCEASQTTLDRLAALEGAAPWQDEIAALRQPLDRPIEPKVPADVLDSTTDEPQLLEIPAKTTVAESPQRQAA